MRLMRSIFMLAIMVALFLVELKAQDIPLFGQKMSNSFIYNPAVAGHTFGSATLAYRRTFGDFAKSTYLSLHTPFGNHKFGIGGNLFSERINFVENIYASGAFAYHINFSRYNTLSLGVSTEYNSIQFDNTRINFEDGSLDPVVVGLNNDNTLDFSFGMHYQNRYFKGGLAANRLATTFFQEDSTASVVDFYSVYAAGLIPMRGGQDILEPIFNYRKLSENSNIWDIGVYYTYNNLLLGGAAWRAGDILSLTVGVRLKNKLMLGYSHEVPNGNFGLGHTNEITLRFDFNEKTYQDRFRQDYKSSLAFRRKTLSSSSKRARAGARTPKSFKKRQKNRVKNFPSPSKRYNNVKKLSQRRHKKKFNNSTRRKKNYKKHYKQRRRRR